MDCGVSNCFAESLHGVLANFLLLLEGLTDLDGIVGSISEHEEGASSRSVELALNSLSTTLESVKLDRAWVLLALVEFFAHELGQHFVDAHIGEERIVVLKKLSLVLELLEIALKFVDTNHLSDARHVHILDLVLEGTSWVFHDHTDARVLILSDKRMVDLDHLRLRCGVGGHTSHREVHTDCLIFVRQKGAFSC